MEGKFECFHTLLCAKFSQKRFLAGTSSKTDKKIGDFIRFGLSRVPLSRPYGLAPLHSAR